MAYLLLVMAAFKDPTLSAAALFQSPQPFTAQTERLAPRAQPPCSTPCVEHLHLHFPHRSSVSNHHSCGSSVSDYYRFGSCVSKYYSYGSSVSNRYRYGSSVFNYYGCESCVSKDYSYGCSVSNHCSYGSCVSKYDGYGNSVSNYYSWWYHEGSRPVVSTRKPRFFTSGSSDSCSTRKCHRTKLSYCALQEVHGTERTYPTNDYNVTDSIPLAQLAENRQNAPQKKKKDSGLDGIPKRYRKSKKEVMEISEVVRRVLQLNHWEDIDGILNHWMGRFDRRNFPRLIKEFTNTGALKHSVKVFGWMKDQQCYRARNDIYNMMIWLHARHQRVDQARGLFFEMQKWRCKPDVDTYNALINVHGRAGQWRWAMQIFDEMLRAAGMFLEARKVLKEMRNSGCQPNVITYTSLMQAYKTAGKYHEAALVYKEMEEEGLSADAVACSALFSALNKADKPEATVMYGRRMLSQGVRLNDIAYKELFVACSKLSDWKTGLEFLQEAQSELSVRITPAMLYHLLVALSRSGKLDRLLQVFNAFKKSGMKPTVKSYNLLLCSFSRALKWRRCIEILGWFEESNLEPSFDTYRVVLNCLAKVEQWEEYLLVSKQMLVKGFNEDFPLAKSRMIALYAVGEISLAKHLQGEIGVLKNQAKVKLLNSARVLGKSL
ncbi:hypothetical protein O6H91_01G102700 [Diphasiastrum complanatum]|uniref:Uncharacterized protein n=1 Tax=Diphasiastrum complanatum TaxID=34168 RepID=A0ACC2EUA0_DIPCM|nr:hypothetical protein O6H91_01G102700 [Diphasiastrum complanatum]